MNPPTIANHELENLKRDSILSMRFQSPHFGALTFYYIHGKTRFALELHNSINLPEHLKKQCIEKLNANQQSYLVYEYKKMADQELSHTITNHNYCPIPQPLQCITKPVEIKTISKLAAMIQKQCVVFYTGAGISADVVPDMQTLMNELHFSKCNNKELIWSEVVELILTNPKTYNNIMKHFFTACVEGNPTPAHAALAKLVQKMGWGLLTENLDFLHENSGIKPLKRTHTSWLQDAIRPNDLAKIDYVIVIGLSSDESGFLAWYKQHNPQGTMIAINKEIPPYVGANDYYVLADIQKCIPELMELILI